MEKDINDNYNTLTTKTHYKNIKTEIMENKSKKNTLDNSDYSKINSTKDLLKEKDKKIEILEKQMRQLQKKLEQQQNSIFNNNYQNYNSNNSNSANNINYCNTNSNTSTNFPLKNEIKKIWEEFALVSLLDNFIDFEKKPEIIFHFVSEMILIADKLINELCLDMYKKVSISLNIINDKKIINDIEKTSRPLIKEHLNKTFAGTNNQQFLDRFIDLFKISVKKIIGDDRETQDILEEIVEGSDFKLMIKKIKDILLYTKFNDQQLFFQIEKNFHKRIVEKITIKGNSEKKKFIIINDNNREQNDAVVILKPPVLRSGFPLNNDFKTIIILYENDSNSKSYKTIIKTNDNNKIDILDKGTIKKIVGMKIQKMIPYLKSITNNIQINIDECNNYKNNNLVDFNHSKNEGIRKEEIINTVFSKEKRNTFQKLSKKIEYKLREEKNNCKTQFNNNENDIQFKEFNDKEKPKNEFKEKEELGKEIAQNNFDDIKIYKKTLYKNNDNSFSELSEKRNTTINKNHRFKLIDPNLKNNSSKNLLEYTHKVLLNNSSSQRLNINQNEESYNREPFITFNNNEVNDFININDNNEDEDNNNEIIYQTKTTKGIFNGSGNYKKSKKFDDFEKEIINNNNTKERNSNNIENIINSNKIYTKKNEDDNYLNDQIDIMKNNQIKEKLYKLNSLNKKETTNRTNNNKNLQKYNFFSENNKNYSKINKRINNLNQLKKPTNNYYKMNNINDNLNQNNNKNKLRVAENSNNNKEKIYNNNLCDQNKNKNNIKKNDQKSLVFKKYRTTKLINNKEKNNNSKIKQDLKITPLNKMKAHQNQLNNYRQKSNNNQSLERKSSNKIINSLNNDYSKNNKIIDINNSNIISDNYRKYKNYNKSNYNNNNINKYIMENANNSKNIFIVENNINKNINNTEVILNMSNTNKNNLEENKYDNGKELLLISNINNHINNNLSRDRKHRQEMNNKGMKNNNNILYNNCYNYNDINNTGYKIKNLNINYFNIMQPNKLFINQNSTRSKSRPGDGERNRIMINYNDVNGKEIKQNVPKQNSKNIEFNNYNNNFDKINNRLISNTPNNNINNIINFNVNTTKILNQEKNNKKENSKTINNTQNNIKMKKTTNYPNKNINKMPLSIITDLTNIERISEHIKNEKKILMQKNGNKNNTKKFGLKEEIVKHQNYNNIINYDTNNNDNIIKKEENTNSLFAEINNQSSNKTSRKKKIYHIKNNKHISYIKIRKQTNNNNENRPISGGIRLIEKDDNNNCKNKSELTQII